MKVMCIPIRDEFCFFQESSKVSFGCDVFVLYVIFKFPLFLLEGEKKKERNFQKGDAKAKNSIRQPNNSTHSITAGELDAAWVIFDDLLHLFPCGGQGDL